VIASQKKMISVTTSSLIRTELIDIQLWMTSFTSRRVKYVIKRKILAEKISFIIKTVLISVLLPCFNVVMLETFNYAF